ncbi:MAG TPA: hypothetical protein VFN10_05870 [Thermoanaerobaculia bacterium]|nr:hypothetical protein [Thermoanaerobaculia bacterium]
MDIARTGEVVWYVTGRFYSTTSTPAKLLDVGYFLHLQGIDAPLFADKQRSESTAFFTFAAEPFTAPSISNGGLDVGLDARGTFRLYLRDVPRASFDDPMSFAQGVCIGTFERVAIVPTVKVGISSSATLLSNVFTARLVASQRFRFTGVEYDLADLIGFGITQWGTAATETLTPPAGYGAVVPFVGSAIRVG